MESLACVNLCARSETAKVGNPLDQCVKISVYGLCGASLEFRSVVFSKQALRQNPFVVRRSKGNRNDTLNANSR